MFLCLSHDVVAHETAHALLDGLRDKFMAPSSADQAALHEAFADIVALLSVFSLPEVVCHLITPISANAVFGRRRAEGFVRKSALSSERLEESALFGLAEQMRSDASDSRGQRAAPLRQHQARPKRILTRAEYEEEHRRGEVFVAAVMRGIPVGLGGAHRRARRRRPTGWSSIEMAAEQGADIADTLLTMAIRAIDYTPPIHIGFGDFLSAILTADTEVRSDDSRYELRRHLTSAMADSESTPASEQPQGLLAAPQGDADAPRVALGGLQTDPTEMFRHIWNNRDALNLNPEAYTRVASVRPCLRISPTDGVPGPRDGRRVHPVPEAERRRAVHLPLAAPAGYGPPTTTWSSRAASTLILDEYGDLKFEVSNRVLSRRRSRPDIDKWQTAPRLHVAARLSRRCEPVLPAGRPSTWNATSAPPATAPTRHAANSA